jgi:hypothetical protein
MKSLLTKTSNRNAQLYFDTINSYPMGKGVNNGAHPDLLYLAQLDGVMIDLRVVYLDREVTDCVLSSVRRFVKDNPYKDYRWQARSAQESLIVINNSLLSLQCGKFMRLPYEQFTATPLAFAEDLAKLMGVQTSVMVESLKKNVKFKKPSTESHAIKKQRAEIDSFFQVQQVLWPLLHRDRMFPAVNITRPRVPSKN